jgi:hypothetical protein
MLGLMPEKLHSEERSETAETHCKQKKGLLGDPPAAFLCLGFVCSVHHQGDNGHYCVKHKKYFHVYIIIDAMRFSNAITGAFFRTAVLTMCLAVFVFAASCSAMSDDPDDSSSDQPYSGQTIQTTGNPNGSESYAYEPGSGYDRISKACIYSSWYDIEKDNPATYSSIDTNDAYALKCVFYFNEPITGTFTAVLRKDGQQVSAKQIRLISKVVCECDFSAGLEGIGTFEPGVYNVQLVTEGKSVSVSGEMRVK